MKRSYSLSPTLGGLLAALTLACSCGDSADNSTPSGDSLGVTFLTLEDSNAGGDSAKVDVVKRLGSADSGNWVGNGCTLKQVKAPVEKGGERIDVVNVTKQEKNSEVSIPGPFDPATFNRVVLRARWIPKWEASVLLKSKGEVVTGTPGKVIPPGKGPETLFFDLPATRRLEAPIDEIVLKITGLQKPLSIISVDLIRKPEYLFLPTPKSGPSLVTIGEEDRSALGVTSSRSLSTTVENVPGSKIRFSYGIPPDMRRKDEAASLSVAFSANGSKLGEVSVSLGESRGWMQRIVDLDEYPAGPLDVEWSVKNATPDFESVCALAEATLLTPGNSRGVVVLVTSDTHRGDHLGSAGQGVDIDTPRLDALGAQGVFFEDCFSTTNITNPSHIAMMTGVHPRDTGIHNNYTRVADSAPTLAEAFREAGYITYAALSTKHLSDGSSGLGQGFERVVYPAYDFARDGSKTIGFLDDWVNESAGLPVFIWLHVFDAHMPYGKDLPGVARYYAGKRRAFDKSLPELSAHEKWSVRNLRLGDLRDLDYPRALYKAEITDLDERLGLLFDKPFFDGAIIGITADHGEHLGEHDLFFAHEELYRGSLHVPMILTWPGAPAGLRHKGAVSNLDIGRTLLDLSGNLDAEFPGQNLALLLEQEPVSAPRFFVSAHGREAAMNEDGWHFQLRLKNNDKRDGDISRPKHSAELYYLTDDPDSKVDLLEKEMERATSMRASLVTWLSTAEHKNWLGGDSGNSESLADLIALGYSGKDEDTGATKGASLAPPANCPCEWCAKF
ncbi:MAG: sulfatase [Planctomycetota bacterium]|jgi:arylsulfatase A-like enzyme|nr:sulfatase [Planctomycetota bacterium]